MQEEGVVAPDEQPSNEEVRRYDKRRRKKVSNAECKSPTDPDSRIAQMKDGRTHLAYKAEHVVDLESDLLLAAEILPATAADTETLVDSVMQAQVHLQAAGSKQQIEEVTADKGYHAAAMLELAANLKLQTYIPEPRRVHQRRWTDKPAEHHTSVVNNRRRVRRAKSKRLQRLRSERCERSFSHVCDSGGMRRTWLHSLVDTGKRYVIAAAAYNLSRILRALFGIGKPRALQGPRGLAAIAQLLARLALTLWIAVQSLWHAATRSHRTPALR